MASVSFRHVISLGAAVLLAACSVSDTLQPRDFSTPSTEYQVPESDGGTRVAASDTSRGYLMVGPQGGNWVFGEHKIVFPANSVCDMSQTNYFAWGQPCVPISSTIRIDLKWWRDAAGHPHVDFQQALRFQPTRKGEVTLHLKDQAAARADRPVIGYCVTATVCVDEGLLDSSLATRKDSKGGFVYRIIRHFSGYNVWA